MLKKIKASLKSGNTAAFIGQFIKFGLVGLSNTIISTAITYVFLFIDDTLLYTGYVVGFVVSVLNAYLWNSRYVFENVQGKKWKAVLKVYVSYGLSFLLGFLFMYIFVDIAGQSKWLAQPASLCFTIPLNFFMNKYWAFKKSKKEEGTSNEKNINSDSDV
ncbi:putative flippase GtrA [Lachnospiraceae bacterium PF1-21]|uniref:GtrA family protein n=1 Tax=Ohessyouella blattaphilus TaxID=2949333 RepID=UPI003E1D6A7D